MPEFDVADEMFVARSPSLVALELCGPRGLARWVPGLALDTVTDRGPEGRLWRAAAGVAGIPLRGTAEIWCEAWHDGTVVHLFVRLDPATPAGGGPVLTPAQRRVLASARVALVDRWKHAVHRWRDTVDAAREPGCGSPSTRAGTAR